MAREVPQAKIERNRVAIYYESENGGKALKVEGQLNAYPWLNQNAVAVFDANITV